MQKQTKKFYHQVLKAVITSNPATNKQFFKRYKKAVKALSKSYKYKKLHTNASGSVSVVQYK